jgi:hypothetical protein
VNARPSSRNIMRDDSEPESVLTPGFGRDSGLVEALQARVEELQGALARAVATQYAHTQVCMCTLLVCIYLYFVCICIP